MHVVDKILEIHHDPKKAVTREPISSNELSPGVIAHLVQEDATSYFIKGRGGEYLLYCNKKAGGAKSLEMQLNELWARYTRKRLNPDVDYGFRV